MIFNKNKINSRRFGKKAVQLLLKKESWVLDVELTEKFSSLNMLEFGSPTLYRLDTNVLYVHDCELIAGKGDVYSIEEIERSIRKYASISRVQEKMKKVISQANGPVKWDVFSRLGSEMINNIPELLKELSAYLEVPTSGLDRSYKSLDLVSSKINDGDSFDNIVANYDAIFVYIGEVLRKRSGGEWRLSEYDGMPYIGTEFSTVSYNPLNVMGDLMTGDNQLDVRKLVVNEYKSLSKRLSYERHKKQSKSNGGRG